MSVFIVSIRRLRVAIHPSESAPAQGHRTELSFAVLVAILSSGSQNFTLSLLWFHNLPEKRARAAAEALIYMIQTCAVYVVHKTPDCPRPR